MTDEPADRTFVEVMVASDPMHAAMIRQALEAEGIEVVVQGEHHRALLGPIGGYVELRVLVLSDQAEAAHALLQTFKDGDFTLQDPAAPSELEEDDDEPAQAADEGPYRTRARGDNLEPTPLASPRSRRVAAIVPFFFPGAGCLYTRQTTAAMVLWAAALTTAFAFRAPGVGIATVVTIGADLILSIRAIPRVNAGESISTGEQLRVGIAAWVAMFVLSTAVKVHAIITG